MTTMTTIKLRAWAKPLAQNYNPSFQNLDHTWVTDFPMEINSDVISMGGAAFSPLDRFWSCRGKKHKIASQRLGVAPAMAEIVDMIAPLNTQLSSQVNPSYYPSYVSGSIVYYGLDGVSHNVANQVLCATGTARRQPLRVQDAKGYALSSFFFSTYGLNTKSWDRIAEENLSGIILAEDDFLTIIDRVVPDNKQERLLDIRADLHADLRKLREVANASHGYDYFPKLFKLALKYLSLAELRLGTPLFERLFSKTASRDVSWLHPEGELSPAALQTLSAMEISA